LRPDAEQCAGGTFVVPSEERGVTELAVAALDALGYFGLAEVEVLYDPSSKHAYLVEINARPWLQFGLSFACGTNLLEHALGMPPQQQQQSAGARSHAWLYFSSDLYACFSRTTGLIRTRKMTLAQYLRSLAQADVYATWDWLDPAPAIESAYRTAANLLGGMVKSVRLRGIKQGL
jgi:predicted ATP-grasp superfamily ATP-dependent carboligase